MGSRSNGLKTIPKLHYARVPHWVTTWLLNRAPLWEVSLVLPRPHLCKMRRGMIADASQQGAEEQPMCSHDNLLPTRQLILSREQLCWKGRPR